MFYTIDLGDLDVDLRFNVNNLLDTRYISEMWTNNADDPSTSEDEFLTTNQGWYGLEELGTLELRLGFKYKFLIIKKKGTALFFC